MQGLIPRSFHEDVVQDELVKRLEILDRPTLISTLENMMIHFLEKNQELSKEQLNAIYRKALDLEFQVRLGATIPYVVQEMRQYVRDQSKYDTTLQDFLSSVYEALPTPPTVQQAADVYTEIIMAPVTIAVQVVNQALSEALEAVRGRSLVHLC